MQAYGNEGDDKILQNGEDGDDEIMVDGGPGDDQVTILGGDDSGGGESDHITYYCSEGNDKVFVDGGPGHDVLCLEGCEGEDSVRESSANVEGAFVSMPSTWDFTIGTTRFIIRRVEECYGCPYL